MDSVYKLVGNLMLFFLKPAQPHAIQPEPVVKVIEFTEL